MTWVVRAIAVSNNVLSGTTGDSVVSVEDYSGEYTAEQLGVTLDGNAYQRQGASSPKQLIKWSRGKGDPYYATLAAFTGATKQEKNGVELGFASAGKATWLGNGPDSSPSAGSVRPVPPSIRKLLGWDDSVHRLGAH
jgi:hypothetical protein